MGEDSIPGAEYRELILRELNRLSVEVRDSRNENKLQIDDLNAKMRTRLDAIDANLLSRIVALENDREQLKGVVKVLSFLFTNPIGWLLIVLFIGASIVGDAGTVFEWLLR